MKLFSFIQMMQCHTGGMQFKLNDEAYVLSSIKPKVVNDITEAIILELHNGYGFTSIKDFNQYYINNLKGNFCYELLFEIDSELYDFSEISIKEFPTSNNLACVLKKYEPKVADYTTLQALSNYARVVGMGYLNYDLSRAKLIINVDGVAHQLKPEDVHFTTDEYKGKAIDYNVVLDVKTK